MNMRLRLAASVCNLIENSANELTGGEQVLTVDRKLTLHCIGSHLLAGKALGVIIDVVQIVLDN